MSKPKSIDDIIAAAKPVERSVTVCLSGDLNLQIEELERELLSEVQKPHTSLGGNPRERELAELIESTRAEMADHEVTFTFRALPAKKWSDLMSAHPGRTGKDEAFNVETFPSALIAACAIAPVMTVEQADALAEVLNNAQYGLLFDCAWRCNQKELDVPFSVLASRVLRESETK